VQKRLAADSNVAICSLAPRCYRCA